MSDSVQGIFSHFAAPRSGIQYNIDHLKGRIESQSTNHGDQKVLRTLITEDIKCLNMCPLAKSGFKVYESRSVGYLYWSLFGHDLNWHTAAADCLGTLAITRFMAEKSSLKREPLTQNQGCSVFICYLARSAFKDYESARSDICTARSRGETCYG